MEGYKVIDFEKTGLSEFEHLQNVWHYFMEHGCYSYSPLHFASAFKTLVIEPHEITKKRKEEEAEEYEKFWYTIYYALYKEKDRKVVEKIPEESHIHEWMKDIILHDPMELLGSYEVGKILETDVRSDCIECSCSLTLEEFENKIKK